MKTFILKLTLFLLPIALLLGSMELRLRNGPNSYTDRRDKLENMVPRVEVLVTGSSHAALAINPNYLSKLTFNLAWMSQDLYFDSQLMRKYMPRAGNLKMVIITISYFSLSSRLPDSIENWRAPFYTQTYDIPPEDRFDMRNYSYCLLAINGPRKEGDTFTRFLAFNRERSVDELGYHLTPEDTGNLSEIDANGRVAIARHQASMKTANVPDNLKSLRFMLDVLKERHIGAVIITTPCSPTYCEGINQQTYKEMQNQINVLCQEYGLDYLNYLNDPRFPVETFLDGDHLNYQGAVKFSKIIDSEVLAKYFNAQEQ
jgi:hypothetical protein